MGKVRVYELAKKMGLENKELLAKLAEAGVEAASHSSSLSDEDLQKFESFNTPTEEKIEEARIKPGEHAAEPYLKLNPYGQVPTAEFDGIRMIESTAICLALAERHPEAGLIPGDRQALDRFWQTVHMASSTLEFPVVMYYLANLDYVDRNWASPITGNGLQFRPPSIDLKAPLEEPASRRAGLPGGIAMAEIVPDGPVPAAVQDLPPFVDV